MPSWPTVRESSLPCVFTLPRAVSENRKAGYRTVVGGDRLAIEMRGTARTRRLVSRYCNVDAVRSHETRLCKCVTYFYLGPSASAHTDLYRSTVFAFLAAALVVALYRRRAVVNKPKSPIETLDAAEVATLLNAGKLQLIDVREPAEYASERIAGALLYPLSTFDATSLPDDGARGARDTHGF